MSIMDKTPEARPGSLESAADAAITWRYIAPVGHTLEMCQAKSYWKNVLREVGQQRVPSRHAFNRIEILAEDGSWEAELRVIGIDGDQVSTRVLRVWRDAKTENKPLAPKDYVVEFIRDNGWRALDPKNTLVAEKLTTEADAIRAAIEHAKKAKT